MGKMLYKAIVLDLLILILNEVAGKPFLKTWWHFVIVGVCVGVLVLSINMIE